MYADGFTIDVDDNHAHNIDDNGANTVDDNNANTAPPSVMLFNLPTKIKQEDGSRDRFEKIFQSMDLDNSKGVDWSEFE